MTYLLLNCTTQQLITIYIKFYKIYVYFTKYVIIYSYIFVGVRKISEKIKEKYHALNNLSEDNKSNIMTIFESQINKIKNISTNKVLALILDIPLLCFLHYHSRENRRLKNLDEKRFHPIRPIRGEIYNAHITENVGSELCRNHLVIIISNKQGNLYSEKVNVLPIEGDGNIINENYQMKLTNEHLEWGKLDKDPSRIIITDILTLDKARLGNKIGKIKEEIMLELNGKIVKQLNLYVDKAK